MEAVISSWSNNNIFPLRSVEQALGKPGLIVHSLRSAIKQSFFPLLPLMHFIAIGHPELENQLPLAPAGEVREGTSGATWSVFG